MTSDDMHDDMFPGEDDNPGEEDNPGENNKNEEELWFEAPGESPPPKPEDSPDYNFRDDTRRTYIIVSSIIAVFLFGGVVWYLYYQKNLRDADNPPVIEADSGPVRERPDDPGGMEVQHQDKLIYDVANGDETELEDSVQPGPEQPINDLDDRTIEDLIEETEPAPPVPAAQEPVQMAAAGSFAVQLGVFSQRQTADTAWADAQGKHGALLGNLNANIDQITNSAGRTLYRLRTGAFETQAEANRLCGQLKQQGQDCLVNKR